MYKKMLYFRSWNLHHLIKNNVYDEIIRTNL